MNFLPLLILELLPAFAVLFSGRKFSLKITAILWVTGVLACAAAAWQFHRRQALLGNNIDTGSVLLIASGVLFYAVILPILSIKRSKDK